MFNTPSPINNNSNNLGKKLNLIDTKVEEICNKYNVLRIFELTDYYHRQKDPVGH